MTRREMLMRTGLAAGATGLALGLAEVLTRVFAQRPAAIRSEAFTQNISEAYHLRFEEVFESDPEAFWRLRPHVRLPDDAWPLPGLVSNGQGLREDHEIPSRKGDRDVRILFLGDSCTFGYGLRAEQTFVELTEQLLHRVFPGVSIDCINAAVPGYTIFQGWRALETRGLAYHPDAVVLVFGWNELAEWDGTSDLAHYEHLRATTPPPPLSRSRLCGLIWGASHPWERPDAVGRRPRLVPYEFREVLGRIGQTLDERGIDLLLLIWPSSENLRRDHLTPWQLEQVRFAATRRFGPGDLPAAVDGVDLLRRASQNVPASDLFLDAVHASAATQPLLAEALARRLAPWLRERTRT